MTKITLTGEQVEALKAVMAKLSNAADSWLEIGQNDGPEAADIYQDLYYGWMELAGHFEQQATHWKAERDEVRDHNADIMLQLLELNGGNVELIAERDALAAKVRELQGEVKWKERDK